MTSEDKKKILVLTQRLPYPVIGGDRLRIYQICKALSTRFSLTLLSLCETRSEMAMDISTEGVFDRVGRILLPKYQSYVNLLRVLPTNMPLQVGYYKSAPFQAEVDRLLPAHDGVLCHLIRSADYVRHCDKPKILEMTDAISLNYSRMCSLSGASGLKYHLYRTEANRLNIYEKSAFAEFDLSVLVSDVDRDFLTGGANHPNVLVASNGVDRSNLPFSARPRSGPIIAYIGNMTSMQNMDACMYFATQVLPPLRRRIDATFRVVGRITERDARTLRSLPGVEVTGAVANVAEAVKDARIGVCPVRFAAGVQNKVLEYMALGLPVVCSTAGLEGFSAKPAHELLLANSVDDYVQQIERIWSEGDLRADLARNALAYVRSNHDWDAKLSPMVDRIAGILENNN